MARRLSLRAELPIKSRGSNGVVGGEGGYSGEGNIPSRWNTSARAEAGIGLAWSRARKEPCVTGAESARLRVVGKRKRAGHAGSCKNAGFD